MLKKVAAASAIASLMMIASIVPALAATTAPAPKTDTKKTVVPEKKVAPKTTAPAPKATKPAPKPATKPVTKPVPNKAKK